MKIEKQQSYKKIYKTLSALLIIFTFYIAIMPNIFFAFETTSNVSEKVMQDEFDKKFREGRDLIDKEEWAKSAEKFKEAVSKYPNNKSVDAALYWLGFCQSKLKQFKEANATLDRLVKEFPNSTWADDARVMKVGFIYSFPNSGVYKELLATSSKIKQMGGFGPVAEYFGKPKLDREDEIKLAAFQSLFSADAKRAIEALGEILKTDSTASETFKREALRVVRNPRLTRVQNQTSYAFTTSSGLDKKLVPLLRETLIKGFQNESNVKIRQEIVYVLANMNDAQSANYLTQLYASENNKEIKKAIINSYGGSSIFQFMSPSNYIFSNSSDNAVTRKSQFDSLWKIANTEKDSELRLLALNNLRKFNDLLANTEVIQRLTQVYDAETDEQIKSLLIRTLAGIKQKQATKKLLGIAKNEKSDKLKLEAIYSLRNSKDPEVLKFLEQMIK